MEFLLLLASPLAGALILGVFGARRWAPELNVAMSLATFLAACALTARVVGEGNLLVAREQFFIDPFNVFLVTLTAFVGLTTSLFSRPYMRVELRHRRVSAPRLRLYHSMYQLFMTTMLIALTTNNMGLLWVAMEAATLSTVLLVTLYRTRGESRGRLEILHPVRRRHCPGAVRHNPAVLRRRKGSGCARGERAPVDAPECGEGAARARRA